MTRSSNATEVETILYSFAYHPCLFTPLLHSALLFIAGKMVLSLTLKWAISLLNITRLPFNCAMHKVKDLHVELGLLVLILKALTSASQPSHTSTCLAWKE